MQTIISSRSGIAIRPAAAQARQARLALPAASSGRLQPTQWSGKTLAATQWRQHAAPEGAQPAPTSSSAAADSEEPEEVYYEGSGSPAELAISLLLGLFIITLPLTLASVGRRLWVSYKFTSRRLIVTTSSPVIKRAVEIDYRQIKEIRSAARAFGAWGDVVIFLKDGSRLELAGLERFDDLVAYMESRRDALGAER